MLTHSDTILTNLSTLGSCCHAACSENVQLFRWSAKFYYNGIIMKCVLGSISSLTVVENDFTCAQLSILLNFNFIPLSYLNNVSSASIPHSCVAFTSVPFMPGIWVI